jgi:pantothenate kinase type III
MFGAAESIDGIVRRIIAEWPGGGQPMVIGTGGLAELFAPIVTCFDTVDPYLTLRGLALAFDLVGTTG